MPDFVSEEDLKEELTEEQYEQYVRIRDEFGIEEAVSQLPTTTFAIVTQHGAVNMLLRKLRKAHGLTQSDLANMLDVSQREYWRYEQEGYSVNFYTLAHIALFYNISLDCFTGLLFDENGFVLKPMFPNEQTTFRGYKLSEMKEAKAKGEKYKPHNWVLEHLQQEGNSEEE